MGKKQKQFGMSLMEVLVVVGTIAILLGVSLPVAKQLARLFESSTGVRQLINAALSHARAIAVREQAYTGVRFQQDADGNTYLIFIIHDKDATGDAQGFRAVVGRKPMKLPEGVSVRAAVRKSDDTLSVNNYFSVVFSPAGKLTVHEVQCLPTVPTDTIFGTMFTEDADSWFSVQGFDLVKKEKDGPGLESTTEYISPYTGELVMEYREQKP